MTMYMIGTKEVHVQYVKIEAESPESAIEMVENGEGDCATLEYSHTLDDEMTCYEIKEVFHLASKILPVQ